MSGLYLFARIAGTPVAILTEEVEAVVRLHELSPVPGVSSHVAGLFALRSRVLTIIDAAAQIMGAQARSALATDAEHHAIVCNISGHSYGIWVDGVDDIRTVTAAAMPICGKISPEWLPYATGVIEDEDQPHFILQLTRFIEYGSAAQAA